MSEYGFGPGAGAFDPLDPAERGRALEAALRAQARISTESTKARRKARTKRVAAAIPKTLRAVGAAGLSVARVDVHEDGFSIRLGEPQAAAGEPRKAADSAFEPWD